MIAFPSDRQLRLIIPIVLQTSLTRKEQRIEGYWDSTDFSPFIVACEKGYLECSQVMLNEGVDVNTGPIGIKPLHLACLSANSILVEHLLANGARREASTLPIMCTSPGKKTAERLQCLKLLMNFSGDDNFEVLPRQHGPILDAAAIGSHPAINEYLISLNDELDLPTALRHASQSGSLEALRTLIERGAVVDGLSPTGETAWMLSKSEECAQHLLAHGADIHLIANCGGQCPTLRTQDSRTAPAISVTRDVKSCKTSRHSSVPTSKCQKVQCTKPLGDRCKMQAVYHSSMTNSVMKAINSERVEALDGSRSDSTVAVRP